MIEPEIDPVVLEARDRYERLLCDVRDRTDLAVSLLRDPASEEDLERAALHLRIVLELIVLSSLVTRQADFELVAGALDKKDAGEARKLAKAANAKYWPEPADQRVDAAHEFTLLAAPEGWLRESDWGRQYGYVSSLLHAKNPFDSRWDGEKVQEKLWLLVDGLVSLLDHHVIELPGGEYLFIASMKTHQFDRPQVAVFGKSPKG